MLEGSTGTDVGQSMGTAPIEAGAPAAERSVTEGGPAEDPSAGAPVPPAIIQPVQPLPAREQVPNWVRNWLIALSVVMGIQVLAVCGSVAIAGLAASSMPFAFDDSYMDSEDVATQLTYLVQDGDLEGYLELYRDDDASVDRDRVRAEFEKVLASVDTSAGIDYSADQVVRFTDKETDERILRMDLAAYNWNTGNQLGRGITVWVLEEELPEVVLTGRKGRELDGGEYVW